MRNLYGRYPLPGRTRRTMLPSFVTPGKRGWDDVARVAAILCITVGLAPIIALAQNKEPVAKETPVSPASVSPVSSASPISTASSGASPSSGASASAKAGTVPSGKTPASPTVHSSSGTVATASPQPVTSPGLVASPPPVASPAPVTSPSVALPPGIVATGSGTPTVIVVQQPAPAPTPPAGNNWVPGLIGIGLLVLIIVYGLRFAKQRGMTVQSGLEQLGVQMPQDGITSTVPARSSSVSEPPLPSLADLPPPQPAAATGVNISSFKSKVAEPGSPPPVPEAPVRALNPTLLALSGSVVGEVYTFAGPMTVGREKDNTIALPLDGTVSRRHARIDLENGNWVVVDMGSSNGTFVNGQRLAEPRILQRGDEVQFGSVRFRFEA